MPASKKPPNQHAGAAGAFAFALYNLWLTAGEPTQRVMGERANISHSSVSRAMNGRQVPSWASVRAFVIACDADPEGWEQGWKNAKAAEAAEKKAARDAAPAASATSRGSTRPRGGEKTPTARPDGDARDAPHTKAQATETPSGGDSSRRADQPPRLPRSLYTVPEVGVGIRELPPLPLPLREGIAEHLTTPMLLQALKASHAPDTSLLETLASALECDTDTVAECLTHGLLALRARNDRLQQRLAWATPSSSFIPTHLLPGPDVQLVPSKVAGWGGEDQLIVVGKSMRPPGAHHRPAPGEIRRGARPAKPPDRLPDASDVEDAPAAVTRHRLEPAAVVRPLPMRRASSRETPVPLPATEATGTDAVHLTATAATASPLTSPRVAPTTASVSTLTVAPTNVIPAADGEVGTGEPGTASLARGPWWLRHQVGIKISVLWLVALAVCISMLFEPAPAPVSDMWAGTQEKGES